MHMSNFLCVECLLTPVMAARRAPVGIAHHTAVPSNFEPESADESDEDDDEGSADQ